MSFYVIMLILFVTLNTLGCQLLLKKGIIGLTSPQNAASILPFFLQIIQTPYFYAAISLQGLGYFVWMLVISKVHLGLAFAVSGTFLYVLLALLSWLIYGEQLTFMQWAGIVIASIGLMLIVWPSQ